MAHAESTTRRRHLAQTYGASAREVADLEAVENDLVDRDVERGLSPDESARLDEVQRRLAEISRETSPSPAEAEEPVALAVAADRPPARARRVPRPRMPSAPGMEEPADGSSRPVPPSSGERPWRLVRGRPQRGAAGRPAEAGALVGLCDPLAVAVVAVAAALFAMGATGEVPDALRMRRSRRHPACEWADGVGLGRGCAFVATRL